MPPERPSIEPLQITFTVSVGQVWIDPNEIAWYVTSAEGNTVTFERMVTATADAMDVVRKWRRPNGPA